MNCPDCGYIMTAFDKECPRCEKYGKPKPTPPLAVPTVDALPVITAPEITLPVAALPKRESRPPAVTCFLIIAVFAVAFIVIGILSAGSHSSSGSTASSESPSLSDNQILAKQAQDDCKSGLDTNCDEDIKQLRSQGDDEDARLAEDARNIARFLDGRHQ